MVTKDEALKLGLEALESADWYINQLEMIVYSVDDDGTHENRAKVQATITAIKEALAQPAQEPVAWGYRSKDGEIYDCISPEAHADAEGDYTVPLYTTPPQRPFVGLTDDEIEKGREQAMRWAENALKENA